MCIRNESDFVISSKWNDLEWFMILYVHCIWSIGIEKKDFYMNLISISL